MNDYISVIILDYANECVLNIRLSKHAMESLEKAEERESWIIDVLLSTLNISIDSCHYMVTSKTIPNVTFAFSDIYNNEYEQIRLK